MDIKKIFFSYSRTDAADFALRLAVNLKKEGFDVWIDQQDIRAGFEWDLEIEKALETCNCLLFIESESSVKSNNVLDEVYYALEQNKIVIPIIIKDSKTSFRLQRLQYVDFTIGYEKGFANLVKELNRDGKTELLQPVIADKPSKNFFRKPVFFVLLTAMVIAIAAGYKFYFNNDKKIIMPVEKIILPATDSVADKKQIIVTSPAVVSEKEVKKIQPSFEKNPTNSRVNNKASISKPEVLPINLSETFTGEWTLAEVTSKARLKRGYIKIEETEPQKVKIQSSFQFYYVKANDTLFLVLFNGFAGCASCLLKQEMIIADNDVAIASQKFVILKKDAPGKGKAGDTTMDAGSNNTISATVSMHLADKNTILIKVQKTNAATLHNGYILKPFIYTFRFVKNIP